MPRERLMSDWAVTAAATVGIGAVIWLAPLMTDQITFFGDRDQVRLAEASRWTMLPVAAGLVVAAAIIGSQAGFRYAALAALPALIAVPIAWIALAPAYQVVTYGLTAPLALGALVLVALPRLRRLLRDR